MELPARIQYSSAANIPGYRLDLVSSEALTHSRHFVEVKLLQRVADAVRSFWKSAGV